MKTGNFAIQLIDKNVKSAIETVPDLLKGKWSESKVTL